MPANYKNIPVYLKENANFCCWKYEDVNGRKTKVPYSPHTGKKAKTNNPNTFCDFDTAINASGYEGIGIRVDGRIIGIDIDHCISNGEILPWAKEITNRFNNTYIEMSPSGTGIRIFCLLSNNLSYNTETYYIKKGNLEVYIPSYTNRFLTITGNSLSDADVTDTEKSLVWLLETYMQRLTPTHPTAVAYGKSYLNE